MTQRLATLALALVLVTSAASAFAQGYDRTEASEPSRSFFGMPAWVLAGRDDDAVTTGSIGRRRGIDSSAKGGNAAQQERLVPQFGNTAGGPAE